MYFQHSSISPTVHANDSDHPYDLSSSEGNLIELFLDAHKEGPWYYTSTTYGPFNVQYRNSKYGFYDKSPTLTDYLKTVPKRSSVIEVLKNIISLDKKLRPLSDNPGVQERAIEDAEEKEKAYQRYAKQRRLGISHYQVVGRLPGVDAGDIYAQQHKESNPHHSRYFYDDDGAMPTMKRKRVAELSAQNVASRSRFSEENKLNGGRKRTKQTNKRMKRRNTSSKRKRRV